MNMIERQYNELDFKLQSRADVEAAFSETERFKKSNVIPENLVAVALPRKRPLKNAARREKSWYELSLFRKRRCT